MTGLLHRGTGQYRRKLNEAVNDVSTIISLIYLSHAIVHLVVVSAFLGRSGSGWGTEFLNCTTGMSSEGVAENRSAPLSKHTYWSRKIQRTAQCTT